MQAWKFDTHLKPSPNVRLVTAQRVATHGTDLIGRASVLNNLQRTRLKDARDTFQAHGSEINFEQIANSHPLSWRELKDTSFQLISEYAAEVRDKDEAKKFLYAGIAGAGVTGSLLEVIPAVASNDKNYISSSSELANNSLRFAMNWAALSNSADADLTLLLAQDTPTSDDQKLKYHQYRFNPYWFEIDDGGSLQINQSAIRQLPKSELPNRRAKGKDIYFGCPMRQSVPRLYMAMTRAAVNGSLLT